MPRKVAIYVFNEVEVLDFAGPYEVFTTASRVARRRYPAEPEVFSVFTVSQSLEPVRARAGLMIHPEQSFSSHPPADVLVIPGGVVSWEMDHPGVISWIEETARQAAITASVCTGAFLLARAGLLSGRKATTHWEDLADLRTRFPEVTVVEGCRWVDEGTVVTSAGISAGIDMALHLVERLAGRDLAEATARQMEFDWSEAGLS